VHNRTSLGKSAEPEMSRTPPRFTDRGGIDIEGEAQRTSEPTHPPRKRNRSLGSQESKTSSTTPRVRRRRTQSANQFRQEVSTKGPLLTRSKKNYNIAEKSMTSLFLCASPSIFLPPLSVNLEGVRESQLPENFEPTPVMVAGISAQQLPPQPIGKGKPKVGNPAGVGKNPTLQRA
jgi:hypothetical protein